MFGIGQRIVQIFFSQTIWNGVMGVVTILWEGIGLTMVPVLALCGSAPPGAAFSFGAEKNPGQFLANKSGSGRTTLNKGDPKNSSYKALSDDS